MGGSSKLADPEIILGLAEEFERKLDDLPHVVMSDLDASFRRHVESCEKLVEELSTAVNASIRQTSNGWQIAMLGVRSTSTSGFAAAGRNWIQLARKKAGART